MFVTIYSLATLPAPTNLDIPNNLFILDSLPGLPTHAKPDYIVVLATHSILAIIYAIISFAAFATFPTFANLIILATLPTQPYWVIFWYYLLSLACKLLQLLFVTIHTIAAFPTLANLDIPNILFILDSLPGPPTHATPDNIAVLATHSNLDIINYCLLPYIHLLHFPPLQILKFLIFCLFSIVFLDFQLMQHLIILRYSL